MIAAATSSYIGIIDRDLARISDPGERAIRINRELDELDAYERRTGVSFPAARAALNERLEAVRRECRARVAAASAAPSFAHLERMY